jgi:DNA-binding IclR family transcriptional regulator
VAVLELLARHPDERFTLSEVARRCSLNKATAHALLSTLSERGVLLRHPDEKRYSLGPRLVAIGDAARRGYTAVDFAPTVLDALAAATGLQASAWQMAGDHVVCVVRLGRSTNDRGSAVQLRLPLVPPVGLVFMAWSDPATVEAWLARAGAVETVGLAVEALPTIRRQGFGVMESSPEWHTLTRNNGPRSAGVASLAAQRALLRAVAQQPLVVSSLRDDDAYQPADVTAPVFGSNGEVSLAVTVSGMADHGPVDGAELRALGQRVVAAADALTAAVSGRRPELPT